MDRFEKRYHIRCVDLKKGYFIEKVMNSVELCNLDRRDHIQILYIHDLRKEGVK